MDTEKIRGEFRKKAVVWSNDPNRRSVTLRLTGKVIPHISIDPGGYISLSGKVGQINPQYVMLKNNHPEPMKILGMDHDLKGLIRWQLEEEEPGYVYRIIVENTSKAAGAYTGHIYVHTSSPKKPEVVIIISGNIDGE